MRSRLLLMCVVVGFAAACQAPPSSGGVGGASVSSPGSAAPASASAPARPGRTADVVLELAALPREKAVLGYAPDVAPPITRSSPALVQVELEVSERVGKLADGTEYLYWTFGGSVPGPMIRVREGDMVEFTLMNHPESRLPHNIDLHAVIGQGGGAEATFVAPGERKTFTFRALQPGTYVYHCATAPVGLHIANGMYGLIVVEPQEGWPKVDREFYVMQSEFYTEGAFGEPGLQPFDIERALQENPSYVVFNGAAGSLVGDKALRARVGETVRIFFGNGGPNLTSSFHVIGEIFDAVYAEGGSVKNENVQTTSVPAGGSTVVEFKTRVPATYILVDHAIFRAFNKGALGMLVVEGDKNEQLFAAAHQAEVYIPSPGHTWGAPERSNAQALEPPPDAERSDEQRLASGRALYRTHCSSCHGEKGLGVPNVFPALTQSEVLLNTEEVARSIRGGRKGKVGVMPAFGHVKASEIADIISFAQSTFRNKPSVHKEAEIRVMLKEE